jgi:nucleotide-binding universal stress UspA family protein
MFIRHILVPVDFSPRSLPALDYAFGVAELSGATVHVLHVVPAPSEIRVAVDAYLDRPLPHASPLSILDAREQLRETLDTCQRRGIVPYLAVEVGDPAAAIVRMAGESSSDLIILGTRGHRGAAELILGSVAHRVITTAPCPVVTLGEHAIRARAH